MINPLRKYREGMALTAVGLGLKLGVSERCIFAWETGAFQPSEEKLKRIAELMGTDVSRLKFEWNIWLRSVAK